MTTQTQTGYHVATDFTGERTLARFVDDTLEGTLPGENPTAFASISDAIVALMNASAARAGRRGAEGTIKNNAVFAFYLVDASGRVVA